MSRCFGIALAICAAACASRSPGAGALRIATSHYQSMAGVPVKSALGPMTCNREAITGSHVLHWYCRFDGEPTQYQLSAPISFVVR